jgi:hypothetical protein
VQARLGPCQLDWLRKITQAFALQYFLCLRRYELIAVPTLDWNYRCELAVTQQHQAFDLTLRNPSPAKIGSASQPGPAVAFFAGWSELVTQVHGSYIFSIEVTKSFREHLKAKIKHIAVYERVFFAAFGSPGFGECGRKPPPKSLAHFLKMNKGAPMRRSAVKSAPQTTGCRKV